MQGFLGSLGIFVMLGLVALVLLGQDPSDPGDAGLQGEPLGARTSSEKGTFASEVGSETPVADPSQQQAFEDREALLESLVSEAGEASCYEVSVPLGEAARDVLEEQQAQGAALARGGYLDLFGNLWSSITWTSDEVTLTFIKDKSNEGKALCQVTQVHFSKERWEELCGS